MCTTHTWLIVVFAQPQTSVCGQQTGSLHNWERCDQIIDIFSKMMTINFYPNQKIIPKIHYHDGEECHLSALADTCRCGGQWLASHSPSMVVDHRGRPSPGGTATLDSLVTLCGPRPLNGLGHCHFPITGLTKEWSLGCVNPAC